MGKRQITGPATGSEEHGSRIDLAFQHIRRLIVHGNLAPGSWINEADLSRRLGVSRTPVRAALHWLQREGYVVEHKARLNSRMMVAPLTHGDARELYAVVARMEGLAGMYTASLPQPERRSVVTRITALNDELNSIAQSRQPDGRSIFDLDRQFHGIIVEAGAGSRLKVLHAAIKPQTERYWRLYASNILDQLGTSVEEHNTIIRSIAEGRPDRAEAAIAANWINGSQRIGDVIAQHGNLGTW